MMRRAVILALLLGGVSAQSGWAKAPDTSLRPIARPGVETLVSDVEVTRKSPDLLRPRARPETAAEAAPMAKTTVLASSGAAVSQSIRPPVRP